MKFKKLSFKVVEEDIRQIAKSSITLIIGRLTLKFQENTKKLSQSFETESSVDILTAVQDVIDDLEKSIKEMQNLADLIGEVPDVEVEEDEE